MDRDCAKHVEFYSKNKFKKIVHLVCFIIRIYHNARSSECQIRLVDISSYFNFIEYCNLMSAGDTEGVPTRPSLLQNADGVLGNANIRYK
jgi:hypothetical protein